MSEGRWVRRPEGSAWGDFGPDDQVGRMNLITPEVRLSAVAEVRVGLSFCLSLPLDYPGGSEVSEGLRHPPRLFASTLADGTPVYNLPFGIGTDQPLGVGSDDGVVLSTQYSTHWDSLAHWGELFDADGDGVPEPVYYNGYRAGVEIRGPIDDRPPAAGALGIDRLAMTGVQGRGVVVSLREAFGPGRTWVTGDMLHDAMERQGAEVRPGDLLMLHSGFDDALLGMDRHPDVTALADVGAVLDGRDPALREWVVASGLAAICSDTYAIEAIGYPDIESGGHTMTPLHELCLFEQGIHLGELWRLGELSRWMLAAGRTACLITAPPLRLPGAVGSPVSPVATV